MDEFDASNIAEAPFDGDAVWSTLSPELQAKIGAFALEIAVGRVIHEHAGGPAGRAGLAAEAEVLEELCRAVNGEGGLQTETWFEEARMMEPVRYRYRVPSYLGQVCYGCGCSEKDPCPEGCGWASDTLCTACKTTGRHLPFEDDDD
ncbi:hypothetical protein [Methylobacterium sp. J-070]|uniref:hypothetical protein n=1 Tax=Methylobacterium sp. J-070 TaxID=2836650 RepID=UPI001FB8D8EE|nr:hypothetical protein [Methylobacterium sp. J-070]MCJ2048801.1 hypothetical protein [Methylobacterium sp. J-070]